MAVVSLKIGGRFYKFSCADGQEAYMTALGENLDERAEKLLKNRVHARRSTFSYVVFVVS